MTSVSGGVRVLSPTALLTHGGASLGLGRLTETTDISSHLEQQTEKVFFFLCLSSVSSSECDWKSNGAGRGNPTIAQPQEREYLMKPSPVKRKQRLLPSQILQHRCPRRKKPGFVKSLCITSCLSSFTEVKMRHFFKSEGKK